MPTVALIPVKTFCVHHNIEHSFIHTLQRFGLVEIITREDDAFIRARQLNDIERFVRLHRELDINPEGIDAIIHLLQRVKKMQQEITTLQNRLSRYEPGK